MTAITASEAAALNDLDYLSSVRSSACCPDSVILYR